MAAGRWLEACIYGASSKRKSGTCTEATPSLCALGGCIKLRRGCIYQLHEAQPRRGYWFVFPVLVRLTGIDLWVGRYHCEIATEKNVHKLSSPIHLSMHPSSVDPSWRLSLELDARITCLPPTIALFNVFHFDTIVFLLYKHQTEM